MKGAELAGTQEDRLEDHVENSPDAVQSSRNDSNAGTQAQIMAVFFRNRLLGKEGAVAANVAPGFLLKNYPSDCPMISVLFQLLEVIDEQKKLLAEDHEKIERIERLNKEKMPDLEALLAQYESLVDKRENGWWAAISPFESKPGRKELEAQEGLHKAIKAFFYEIQQSYDGANPAAAIRDWKYVMTAMLDRLRQHLALMQEETNLYIARFSKMRQEFTNMLKNLPEGEVDRILASNQGLNEMYKIIMAAE